MGFKRYHRITAAVAVLLLVGSLTASAATCAPMTRAATLPASPAAATSTPTTSTPKASATATSTPKASATATSTPKASATATPKPKAKSRPVMAALTVTPTTANRGGLVTVSGSGFAALETVNILLSGTTG